ncbi:MAG TPA: tRNA preQ1(34) S-adenosylmethionine ribosyltransferase-isomerase QueA [candidate division Zixibacteria bacterium]|nr:tRNA preQ1(34) S-adenosylmethionine ribosyltransferase-isomerase QueA [candidate division Zixibacteria bacterium]
MDIKLFDYELPSELIAQVPARRREDSRLMIVSRSTGEIKTGKFADLVAYVNEGDLLVVNNTKVFKARLYGHRKTGGSVEVFLVRRLPGETETWNALLQPSKRLDEQERIYFKNDGPDSRLSLKLTEHVSGGQWLVEFASALERSTIIERFGHVPLPHYIKRDDTPSDIERYQTIFARTDRVGAVAAPTAGFHFTNRIVKDLKRKGAAFGSLTLHVGPGTFKPVSVEQIEDHHVDPELATLEQPVADRINHTRSSGGKILAVGTTSVRTLEAAPTTDGKILPFSDMVDLYIRPGHTFRFVDRLITNFHLPKSSLLILVSAFASRELIKEAYERAIREKFRFYSYGDAMLIL